MPNMVCLSLSVSTIWITWCIVWIYLTERDYIGTTAPVGWISSCMYHGKYSIHARYVAQSLLPSITLQLHNNTLLCSWRTMSLQLYKKCLILRVLRHMEDIHNCMWFSDLPQEPITVSILVVLVTKGGYGWLILTMGRFTSKKRWPTATVYTSTLTLIPVVNTGTQYSHRCSNMAKTHSSLLNV